MDQVPLFFALHVFMLVRNFGLLWHHGYGVSLLFYVSSVFSIFNFLFIAMMSFEQFIGNPIVALRRWLMSLIKSYFWSNKKFSLSTSILRDFTPLGTLRLSLQLLLMVNKSDARRTFIKMLAVVGLPLLEVTNGDGY